MERGVHSCVWGGNVLLQKNKKYHEFYSVRNYLGLTKNKSNPANIFLLTVSKSVDENVNYDLDVRHYNSIINILILSINHY